MSTWPERKPEFRNPFNDVMIPSIDDLMGPPKDGWAERIKESLENDYMTDEEALAEIWGITCPDCGPQDADAIVDHVERMQTELENLRKEVSRLRVVENNTNLRQAIAILRDLQTDVEGPGYWLLDHADLHLCEQLR